MKKALITGITGQDGSYLAELLLDKGYEVHGLMRRSSSFSTGRIEHIYQDPHERGARLHLHYADLTDSSSLMSHLHAVKPDEVYNLGAQSHVKVSFEMPEFTADTGGDGHAPTPRGDPHGALADPLLPGRQQRDVRQGARDAADGDDAVQPAKPVRDREGLRALDDRGLPRGVRDACLERHPVQSRVPAARRDVRHPQGDARRRGDRRRDGGQALPRQPRCETRLGLRARVRRGDVADAPAGRAGRLRRRDRRDAHRSRVRQPCVRPRGARLGGVRRDRLALLPADRGGRAVR